MDTAVLKGPYHSESEYSTQPANLAWGQESLSEENMHVICVCIYLYPLHLVSQPLSTIGQIDLCEEGLCCTIRVF